ncbi:AAA family ATPase [[Ruminococcus] torques]|uniref:AAA family ATPase n=1 Tax=[Ruminococcus] torques TaxID=33039 RepID=UPI0025A3780A|nr:AAA family ATPase [[Ruminococcus] torques]MDM8237197.1 AAA family ATPase [[Ruminococcus] torques]
MDKYDYKVKTEQMLELMEDGAYRQAAEIADLIDWKRVRNTGMLANVSEIYEKNKEYQKAYEVLNLAYRRAEGSRKIISRLCTLAVKTGNVDEAIDYYDDFVQIAPKDPNQYILRYQILRAQRAPVEQQIEALEEYKKSEYIEEWAYELAKLYQEAGMTAECLEECDDLILWFSEGQYVYKAMELKMQYKPLTPSQQEKYDRRYEKLSEETEEMPDILAYAEAKGGEADSADVEDAVEADGKDDIGDAAEDKESPDEEAALSEESASGVASDSSENIDAAEPKKKKIGDTMPLGEALKKLLHPEKQVMPEEEEEPELDDLADEIGEIESVADIDIVAQIAEEKKKAVTAAGGMTEITPDEIDVEETQEISLEEAEELLPEDEEDIIDEEAEIIEDVEAEDGISEDESAKDFSKNDDQITGQMSLEDILSGWEGAPERDMEPEAEEIEDLLAGDEAEDSEELYDEDAEALEDDVFDADAEDLEDDVVEAEAEDLEDEAIEDQAAADTDNSSSEGEVIGDTMETKKTTAPILPPDIQRMIDEIEGVIPPEEEKPEKPEKRTLERKKEEPHENMGKVAESLRIDNDDFEEEEYFGDDELPEEEFFDEGEAFEEEEEYLDEGEEFEEEEEYLGEGEEFEEEDEYLGEGEDFEEDILESEAEEFDDEVPDIAEEFRINPEHADQEDDREIPDDDDDGMDILSATTPLSRKETAKMIATGKTAPLPLDEISDALSMSDTGFIVHGRYDLEMQSGIGTRAGLTEEQKKLFSYFVPVRGMSEQLVDVLEQDKNCTNRNGTSKSGNLLIIGNKGNGKTVLAVDVVKAIQKQREIKQGKVAIVTGDSLNKKKISDIFDKLYGGALIIEKAGKMNEKTVARLNKAMERDTGELLIVLEEQRKPLDRLLSSNREFRRKFTSRLEIPIFINDELVTFGQTYAQENGYRIDEMGILALYSKIDSLQREDHAVTVAEVKEIMDEAIQHSQKASAKKLMKRVFGKNTDEADRIILSEKDFNI